MTKEQRQLMDQSLKDWAREMMDGPEAERAVEMIDQDAQAIRSYEVRQMPTPFEKLQSLDRTKQTAFLALFAGARMPLQVLRGPDGKEWPVKFGKAECEWVPDWRDFYGRELPALGFATFAESDPSPALGAAPGSTFTQVTIGITDEGCEAREAYWNWVNE